MTLELEAVSKAAAERKAAQAGMVVNHCQEASDPPETRHSSHRGEVGQKGSKLMPALVLLVIAGAVAWFFWPRLVE